LDFFFFDNFLADFLIDTDSTAGILVFRSSGIALGTAEERLAELLDFFLFFEECFLLGIEGEAAPKITGG
jgi:hypothetical protein